MKRLSIVLTAFALAPLASGPAYATNGYFAHGYGTACKATAGACVALSQDALAAATNPAAIAFLGHRYDVGAGLFNPNREYSIRGLPSGFRGTFGLPPGSVASGSRLFLIPHLGANWTLGDSRAFGVAVYGNGGMNTDYPARTFHGASPTGVDLSQLFLAPSFAMKLDARNAVGITALMAYQRFEARGTQAFAVYSSNPRMLSNNDHDNSFGAGLRVGYLGRWSDRFSVGASYQTKVYMGAFDSYSGLFAGKGDFDIPDNWVVGIAVKPSGTLTVLADVQQVRYSRVASVGNPMLPNMTSVRMGDVAGPGFGWRDMTIYKLGLQARSSGDWTWRAGYSYGEQPVPPSEVLFNILAPGVEEHHASVGFSKALSNGRILSLSLMRAFSKTVTGPNPMEAPGRQSIDLKMNQWELELSFAFGIGR